MMPDCFGLPSIHDRANPVCAGCAVADQCGQHALAKAIALSQVVDTKDIVRRLSGRQTAITGSAPVNVTCSSVERMTRSERVKVDLTGADQKLISELPVKVAKKARLLMERNIDQEARDALREGRNPFPFDGAKYLHVACRELLADGFTRAELRHIYMKELGWSEGTAFSHVSAVVSLFPALRFAKELAGRFVRIQ